MRKPKAFCPAFPVPAFTVCRRSIGGYHSHPFRRRQRCRRLPPLPELPGAGRGRFSRGKAGTATPHPRPGGGFGKFVPPARHSGRGTGACCRLPFHFRPRRYQGALYLLIALDFYHGSARPARAALRRIALARPGLVPCRPGRPMMDETTQSAVTGHLDNYIRGQKQKGRRHQDPVPRRKAGPEERSKK